MVNYWACTGQLLDQLLKLFLLIFFSFQCSAANDARPVRKLRDPENVGRERAQPAQSSDAQDPGPYVSAAQIYIWQAHHFEAGQVFHKNTEFTGSR